MTQPEGLQRCVFQRIENAAQERAQAGPPRHHVVEAGIDDAVMHDARLGRIEQAAQPAGGVGAHVRRQAVAQRVGQIIDERGVAEMVAAAPVMAVRLEGIEAVRAEDHDPTAGPDHPQHLPRRGPVVGHMLDHLVGEEHIEAGVGERQRLGRRDDDPPLPGGRLARHGEVNLDAGHVRTETAELLGVHPDAAAGIQDGRAIELRPLAHQRQPAFLSRAPHVGGMPQPRGFVGGTAEIFTLR